MPRSPRHSTLTALRRPDFWFLLPTPPGWAGVSHPRAVSSVAIQSPANRRTLMPIGRSLPASCSALSQASWNPEALSGTSFDRSGYRQASEPRARDPPLTPPELPSRAPRRVRPRGCQPLRPAPAELPAAKVLPRVIAPSRPPPPPRAVLVLASPPQALGRRVPGPGRGGAGVVARPSGLQGRMLTRAGRGS